MEKRFTETLFLVLAVSFVLTAANANALTNSMTDASGGDFIACNGRVGMRTSEQLQAQTDLNGDSDANDSVLQVLNLSLMTVTNVGIDASGPIACGGNLFAFGVSEANEETDLNGDGDMFDIVLHVYNASTLTLTNTGLAVTALKASSSLVAFSVPEALQGIAGTDLNGDGDMGDNVLHVFDAVTLVSTNVGRDATGGIAIGGNRVAFLAFEGNEFGVSLNSDADALDNVLQTYDAVTLALVNVGREAEAGFKFDGNAVVFATSESKEGSTSFNPDPDAADNVMQTYCFPAAPCANPGLTNLALAVDGFDFAGDLVAMGVRERRQNGSDLNGDGDRGDSVLFVHHLSTGATTNTTKAIYRSIARISGNFVVFRVPERNQGHTNLNSDSDVRDQVLHVYDAVANTTTNTGRAISRNCRNTGTPLSEPCFSVNGDNVALLTRERDQGRTDLNMDGDVKDRVLELWRLSTATLTSSGVAANVRGGFTLGNSIIAFRRSEREEHADLDGDGDKRELVSAVFDTSTLTTTTLDSAESLFLVEGDTLVIRTREGVESVDLDGDTDFDDGIIQYQMF